MYKIVLVEDDPMARQLLEIYVQSSGRYDLVDSLESALFAEAYCTANKVDAVLMDVCTAMNASGLDAAESIKKHLPHIKIVIITSQPECSFIDRAKAVGVDSFWYKSATAEEILNVLDRTMAGESVFPESTPVLHIGNADSSEFTDRELEVLRLVVAGETDAAIAEKLYMSLRTVKHHIQSMKDKTGFRNRTELAVRARAKGLIINKLQSSE